MTLPKKGSPFVSTMAVLLLLLLMAMFAAATASAQTPAHDPRWRAWLGCWLSSPPAAVRASEMVCVVPAGTASAVDVVTLKDGTIVSRERIDASGARRDTTRDNCPGWERAQWSADGRRVYLESEFQCAGASKRGSSGLIAMSPFREWLDVMSVTMGENTGARVLRHAAAAVPDALPAEIASPLKAIGSAAIEDARALAVAPLGAADVIDASAHVNGMAVEAWLAELRQIFHVDAKRLVEFSKARVPDRVIDLIVALSYPGAFSIAPSPTTVGALAEDESRGRRESTFGAFEDDPFRCGFSYSVYGWGGCSPFAYYPYGFLPYSDFPYAYSRAGHGPYGYWGGYDGWYLTEPTVITLQPGGNAGATHGQVVNGRGYSAGRSDSGASASSGSSGSSAGASSAGSSSSSGGGSSSSGGGGGGDGGGRTAEPR